MPDAVELVRIGPEDWREFRTVRLASLRDAPDAFGSQHADWVDADEQRWRTRLTDVPLTVIARSAGVPVGVVSGVESPLGVELISMWVAPRHRGTGLAGRLIGEVIGWATARGQQTYLMVRDDNVAAIRSYTRVGFLDHGVPDDWPGGVPPERRMWHATGPAIRARPVGTSDETGAPTTPTHDAPQDVRPNGRPHDPHA